MPKYVYHCKDCDGNFETVHGMTENQDHCEICSSSSCLQRIPQMPYFKTFESKEAGNRSPVGDKVKEAIEENRRILKQQKKEATTEWEKDV